MSLDCSAAFQDVLDGFLSRRALVAPELPSQAPGETKGSTFSHPASRWPDGRADMSPRPTVIAHRHTSGGTIGT